MTRRRLPVPFSQGLLYALVYTARRWVVLVLIATAGAVGGYVSGLRTDVTLNDVPADTLQSWDTGYSDLHARAELSRLLADYDCSATRIPGIIPGGAILWTPAGGYWHTTFDAGWAAYQSGDGPRLVAVCLDGP